MECGVRKREEFWMLPVAGEVLSVALAGAVGSCRIHAEVGLSVAAVAIDNKVFEILILPRKEDDSLRSAVGWLPHGAPR